MKIVFVSLASHFTEGMTYQDNYFANQARKDGNEVTVISDCQKFVNGSLVNVEEETTILSNGIKLIRKKYKKILNSFLSSKVRWVPKLYQLLAKENPDLIYCHALEYSAVNSVLKYIKSHHTPFLADEHADFTNSARNFFSQFFLYKCFYRKIVRRAMKCLPCIFCISSEVEDFVTENYKIPKENLKLLPLGGTIIDDLSFSTTRKEMREKLGIRSNEIVIFHSGKLSPEKRTTDILKAFSSTKNQNLRLFFSGVIDPGISNEIEGLIKSNPKITFLGWLNDEQLTKCLCASDVYVQLGSQSATLQNSVCCRNVVAVFPHKNYKTLLKNAAYYVSSQSDLTYFFDNLDAYKISEKKAALWEIAQNELNYEVQLQTIYSFAKNRSFN